MSPPQKIFHLLILIGSVPSTFPHPSSTSSSVPKWKTLPTGDRLNPPIYGIQETHLMPVDALNRNLMKPELDPDTSEPPYETKEHVTYDLSPTDPISGERKLTSEKKEKQAPYQPMVRDDWHSGKHQKLGAAEGEETWPEIGRRKWGQNSLSAWGKRESNDRERRKWGENTMSVWGKRDDDEREKRKWGENTMSVWGKRTPEEEVEDVSKGEKFETVPAMYRPEVTVSTEKQRSTMPRRLRKRSIYDLDGFFEGRGWYNDDDDLDLSKRSELRRRSKPKPYDGPKRNWETNTMKVWGKRSYPTWVGYYYNTDPVEGKRKWTSDNTIRIWGKRDTLPPRIYRDKFFDRFNDYYENY